MSAKWTFWAWEQPIKSAPKKLALLQLANNANDDGKSWYSISKMATACGMSERTFQRSIKDLESDNLLHVERRSNRPSIYHLKDEVEITLHEQGDSVTPLPLNRYDSVTGQGDRESGQGDRESHDLNSYPDTHPIKSNKDLLSEQKNSDAICVLTYLNEICGTRYKRSTKSHIENINARLKDGHSVEDCKLVIDSKFKDWGSDRKWATYLRPQTLFNAGKFQGYLMAAKTKPSAPKSSLHNLQNIDYGQSGKF